MHRQRQHHLQKQQHHQAEGPKATCIVRVLWPVGLIEHITTTNYSWLLSGAVVKARHADGGRMLVAAVLGACPADQPQKAAAEQLEHAAAVHICISRNTYKAALAVLGVWAATSAQAAAVSHSLRGAADGVVLAMYGCQCLVPALQLSGWGSFKKQQLWAPECSFGDSLLPPGTTDVQVGLQGWYCSSIFTQQACLKSSEAAHTV